MASRVIESTSRSSATHDASAGDDADAGQGLERFRPYLLGIASHELSPNLRAKMGASDVVQETLCQAYLDRRSFRGQTERELHRWLRGILVNTIRDLARQYGVAKREVGRESPLGRDVPSGLVDRSLTPRSLAVSREEQEALENALAGLPADYRRVIELRSRDHRSFKEVGDMMGRSPDATRMLWFRAVERLRGELANHDELGR